MTSNAEQPEDNDAGARSFIEEQGKMFAAGFSFSGFERDLVALNLGDGSYLDISGISGADSVSDGRAAVFADLDNDGDLDIFLRAMHGPAHFLFRNEVGREGNWIRISLAGEAPSHGKISRAGDTGQEQVRVSGLDAYGAVVRVKTSRGIQTKVKSGGAGFMSQPDPRLLFGLGEDDSAEWVEITWPSGHVQRHSGPAAGSSVLVSEGQDEVTRVNDAVFSLPDPVPASHRRWRALVLAPGEALPPAPIATLDGDSAGLDAVVAAKGRTLVNFWATWCVPCAAEMPELQKLADAGDLRVVGISLDRPQERPLIPAFLERLGITYPVFVADPGDLETLFSSADIEVPTSLVIEDGRVVDLFSGWSRETRQHLESLKK